MLGKRFRFELAGVSDHNGKATYYEPFLNSLPVSAEGTFLEGNLDEEMVERLGEDYRVKESIFPLLRLDDLNLSPDFVKIDVQGWELNVLRGARETILRSHPVLVIERNRHNERDTTQYLEGLGYRKVDEARLRQDGAVFANESGDSVFVYQSAA
jgi:FkbM family methyltransferase